MPEQFFLMSEGFTFDPVAAAAKKEKEHEEFKNNNPKIRMSLEEIAKSVYEERKAKRESKKAEKKEKTNKKSNKEDRKSDKNREQKPRKDTKDTKDSNRPKQIEIDESSIRKFLQLQKVQYPKDCTLKVMAYPRNWIINKIVEFYFEEILFG